MEAEARTLTTTLEAIAYHEAGHAIMAFEVGRSIKTVSIVPDARGEPLGQVAKPTMAWFRPDIWSLDNAPFQTSVIREALVILAGPLAEERFTGHASAESEGDTQAASDLILRACDGHADEAGAMKEWLTIRARNKVEGLAVWVRIQGLARALLDTPTMTGKQARQVCVRTVQEAITGHRRGGGP